MSGKIAMALCLVVSIVSGRAAAQDETYRLVDPQLKLTRIDSDEKESFLGIHADSAGRLFVGGREGLFVYDPDPEGKLGKRQLLVRFPNHTWIYDIAIRGNDLYVSTVSAIYLIPDAVTKRQDLKPRRFVWGIPLGHVHQCLHNMDWGPEGDLYFTCGDPLWGYGDFRNRPDHWGHWTWFTAAGEKVEYTGVGGVFRIHPDGSGLQVVARGLRNSIGLTFDSQWNLFTNDNDHEQLPADYVPGRLIHVTPHAYFSWPRGWLPSKQPHRPDLLETMNDHLGRYVPVGEVDYEDTYLPEKYRRSLIVCRWGEHKLVYYPIESRGASFKAEEHDLLLCNGDARPVGIAVGSGCLFVTVCHMPANDASPTYRSDILQISRADQEPTPQPYDITAAPVDKMRAELASADWSRRHAAYEEMMRRGNASKIHPGGNLEARSDLSSNDPANQLAAVIGFFDRDVALPQAVFDGPARSSDTYLRQAATLLVAQKASLSQIQSLLESNDSSARLAGVLAAGFRLTVPPATGPLPDELRLDSKAQAGSYVIPNFYDSPKVDLRTLGRVGNFTMAQWWKDVRHTDDQERLFSLLQQRLDDPDQQIRYESAFFVNLLNDPRAGERVAAVLHEFARPAPVSATASNPLDSKQLAERLAQAKNAGEVTEIPPEFAKVNWEKEWKAGNAKHGRELFDSLGCSKCHAITNDSPGGGGPSLAEAGKRFTISYVLESILLPNKVVSPLFRLTAIRLKNREVVSGLVVSETADKLDMRLSDTTLRTIDKSQIDARKEQEGSPMPQGLVRTPEELKDLLAFIMQGHTSSP